MGNLIQYSENNERIQAVSKDPIFIHSEYIYDLPEYNLNMLKKIISNLYTEFIIIEDEPLHLVYLKGGDAKDTRFIQSFITKLIRKQISYPIIIELLKDRFMIQDERARSEYADWEKVYTEPGNYTKGPDDGDIISVIFTKMIDKFKVSIIGVKNLSQLNEIMNSNILF